MAYSLSRTLPKKRLPVGVPPGTRGLTNWWPLNDGFAVKSLPAVGAIYGSNTAVNPAPGPPYANPSSAVAATASTSIISLSATPFDFGGSSGAFTFSFWAYLNSFTTFDASTLGRFVSFGASAHSDELTIMCGAAGTGSIEFRTVQAGTTTIQQTTAASLFTTGIWNHFVGTSDGTTLKFYINGKLVTLSAGGNSPTTAATFAFLCRASATRTINGKMADVRFCKGTQWNDAEIAALYFGAFIPPLELPTQLVGQAQAQTIITGWQNYDEDPPRRRRIIDEPQALALTPATLPVGIAGMAWYAPDEPVPRHRRVTDDQAWAPQVIAQQVTTPPNGWWNQEDQRPARRPRSDDAAWAITPPAQAPTGWFLQSPDPPAKRRRVQDDQIWAPPPLTLQAPNGWFWQASDDPTRRPRRASDEVAFVPLPFPTPTIAWMAPPSDYVRRLARRDEPPAWVPQTFTAASTIAGMAWYAPPEPFRRREPPPEPPPALVLTPATLPVGISGMGWFSQADDRRRKPIDTTANDIAMPFGVFVTPPNPLKAVEWLIRARRRGRR